MKKYIGIDIGGTKVKAGIVTGEGDILKKLSLDANIDNYEVPLLDIVKKAAVKIKEISIDNNMKIEGVGVSAAGQIDNKSGVVIGDNGFIPDWKGTNLKKEINEITNLKVTVDNDANCAALAENWVGNGRGYTDLILYTIGTGIGAGIIVDGKLLSGHRGIAGEIGHMIIEHKGRNCSCGNNGCFEQYGSMTALINDVKKTLDNSKENIDGKYIFAEAKNGNKLIKDCINNFIEYHASAIISLLHIFNPQIVIIGGGVSAQEDYLIEPLRKIVFNKAMPVFTEDFELITAKLLNEAGMIGAVKNYIVKQ